MCAAGSGQQAEGLGVEIFPGFAAAEVLYNDDGSVKGVATGDMGIGKDGQPTDHQPRAWSCTPSTHFSPKAAAAILASSSRGAFACAKAKTLRCTASASRSYGRSNPTSTSRGSSFIPPAGRLTTTPTAARSSITWKTTRSSIGFVVGLGLQQSVPVALTRNSSATRPIRRSALFSKAASASPMAPARSPPAGCNRLPKLTFPGGVLVGDDAGFLNASRIKGSHAAIKSGMLAAEAAFDALQAGGSSDELTRYPEAFTQQLAVRRTAPGAQLQAVDEQGPLHRHPHGRHRPDRCSAATRRGRCITSTQTTRP